MKKGIARKGDIHEGICDHGLPCCPHAVSGTIIEGSENVLTNGRNTARLNDKVIHNCPHCGTGHISSGSSSVLANGMPVARVGDKVSYPGGSGIIITGSDNVKAGD